MDYSKRCQQPNPNPRSVSWVDKAWQKDRLAEPHLLFSSAEHWRWSQPEHWCALRCCVIEDKVILKGFTRLSRTATPLKPSCSAHASKPCRGLYSCPESDLHPARFSQALFPLISVPGWSSRSSSHTPSTQCACITQRASNVLLLLSPNFLLCIFEFYKTIKRPSPGPGPGSISLVRCLVPAHFAPPYNYENFSYL